MCNEREQVMRGLVLAVCRSALHKFHKESLSEIEVVAGLGIEGDAHQGVTVKHRSRVAKDPTQPNQRQVHLIHSELFDELRDQGFSVEPGQLGENITTRGIPLLELPQQTRLRIGSNVELEVTGLRNPCVQIDRFQSGLTKALLGVDEFGKQAPKAGIMSIVVAGGTIIPGDSIEVVLPPCPHKRLEKV